MLTHRSLMCIFVPVILLINAFVLQLMLILFHCCYTILVIISAITRI